MFITFKSIRSRRSAVANYLCSLSVASAFRAEQTLLKKIWAADRTFLADFVLKLN
jgi:hypothetical protein